MTEPSTSAPLRIVSIEDDPMTNDFVRLALRNDGYTVITVGDSVEGLKMLQQDPPDLVLLDIMMPGMDGWELFRQMRAIENLQNVPVIVVTARATQVDRTYAEKIAQVDAYLLKPFAPAELRNAIQDVLARRSLSGQRGERTQGPG